MAEKVGFEPTEPYGSTVFKIIDYHIHLPSLSTGFYIKQVDSRHTSTDFHEFSPLLPDILRKSGSKAVAR